MRNALNLTSNQQGRADAAADKAGQQHTFVVSVAREYRGVITQGFVEGTSESREGMVSKVLVDGIAPFDGGHYRTEQII